jgi:hypothetical protein
MEQFKAGHKWADSCAEGDAFPIRKNAPKGTLENWMNYPA